MASKKQASNGPLQNKVGNKLRRQELHVKHKRAKDNTKRDDRFRRKREEEKNPKLKDERLRRNVPVTLERKRAWDEIDEDVGDGIGLSVDVERLKRQRVANEKDGTPTDAQLAGGSGDEVDSMLGTDSEDEEGDNAKEENGVSASSPAQRAPSPAASTVSTNLNLTPEALAAKFPSLFNSDFPEPKVLITTSLNSTLHHEAELLTSLFPRSVYIPRSAHRYGHKFSIREISSFASNRNYTTVLVLKEDQKRPTGLTMVHLPNGPSFQFSISNWVEGRKLPGHGNPTDHFPELILNNFRTPLGLLTAHLFRSLFPPQPELGGRQVVTLHNQRDYIFLRKHRYVFRDKRPTEKSVVGTDGKEVKGAEEIRAGLQELGPRFTLKLRRIDTGIGRAGSGGKVEWEWKGKMEKQRTKFQL
ncbi:MAG: hypothetical protein M4579_000262 [Chaenotheca gracillima]|nr:MAG: hypothetical protein M4579_000262 [Chaenotheca gracillima]